MSTAELLTVLVPCLNEEGNIEETVADILSIAPDLPMTLQLVLIDDGSTDGTLAKMHHLAEQHPGVRVRVNPRNLGIGRTVMSAYDEIPDGSWVTVIPGDNEFVFASIHNFMRVRDQHDLILGHFQNPIIRTLPRRIASTAFTTLVNALYGFSFRYFNGMKMYKVEVFRGIDVVSSGFAYNSEIVAKAVLRDPLLRVGEVAFSAKGRNAGDSKAFSPKGILRAMNEVRAGRASVAAYRDDVIRASN